MTNAPARAVACSFGTVPRAALIASMCALALFGNTPSATAASCSTTINNDTCVLALGDEASAQDGQAGSDTLQFGAAGTYNTTAAQFGGSVAPNFINFELATVLSGSTLNITSASGNTPASLIWNIAGILNVSGAGANSIGDASAVTIAGTGIFNVNENETIGALDGSGSIVVAASKILSANGGATPTIFSGVISGAGGFTKIGVGTLTFSGINTYAGPTTVTAGTLILSANNTSTGAVTVNGGALEIGNIGAIDNASAVTTGSGGWLRGTTTYNIVAPVINGGALEGNANITGSVTNNGVLRPGNYIAPASGATSLVPSIGSISMTGDYTASGTNAFLDMDVDLDAAIPLIPAPPVNGVTHDFFGITGNVTGTTTTRVFLREFDTAADAGRPTTGNGIQLINVTLAGAAGTFTQANALNSGAYQYLLTYIADYSGVPGSADGYFLKSAVRDELIAQPALLSAGQNLIRNCFRDDQRVPDSPKGATYGRAWIGYHQGNTSFGADTGIDMSEDFNCTNGGMDWRMGYGWFGGVSGGFGKVNADLASPAGGGTLDGSARVIEAYASYTSSSLFVNLSAGYADMDWTYLGALLGSVTTSTSGLIGSAQAGMALDVAPFAVKIFGSLDYDDTNCGGSCFGVAVTEDTGLLQAKGTIRFDGVSWGGSVRPWAAVSYSDVLSDGINTVSLGAVSVSADTNSALLSIDAGLQAYLDENLALFADGGYHEGLNKDITGYKAGVGLKLYW